MIPLQRVPPALPVFSNENPKGYSIWQSQQHTLKFRCTRSSHCIGSNNRANWDSHNRPGTRIRHIASVWSGFAGVAARKA